MRQRREHNMPIIGPSAYISIAGHQNVPAKIDTGAGASSIWASHIKIDEDGVLKFQLFDKSSPFYTGETIERRDYKVLVVRSAMGHEQIRYRVYFSIVLNDRKIKVLFSLANRSKNSFPVLIGRRTLHGKFMVDVSLPDIEYEVKPKQKIDLKQFREDPHTFHERYMNNEKEREIK